MVVDFQGPQNTQKETLLGDLRPPTSCFGNLFCQINDLEVA